MAKYVTPPTSYRIPILPTLAAVGLSLLVLPACGKSQTDVPVVSSDEAMVDAKLEGESPMETAEDDVSVPVEDPPEVAVPDVEEPPAVQLAGDVVLLPESVEEAIPLDVVEKPSKVRPEKPPEVHIRGRIRGPSNPRF
ncbi:MAG: hypothetical protein FWC40_00750 [Proteobacteria bacterium]|nr:hypothetical protein [Pseudomonadota bacterium]